MNADERLEEFYYFSLFLENFAAERILSENNNFTSTKQNNSKAIIFFRNMIAAEKKSAEKLEDGSSSSDGVEGHAPITGGSKKLRTRWCPTIKDLDQIAGYVHGTDDGQIIPGIPVGADGPGYE